MPDSELPKIPYYRIPYTDVGAAYVGMFVATWCQIDFFLSDCIGKMLGTDMRAVMILSESMTTGPKLNLFSRLAKETITDPDILKAYKEFHAEISPLIDKRNIIVHGMWGFWKSEDYQETRAGAFWTKKEPEIFVDDIPALTERVARQTHNILRIRQFLYGDKWAWAPERQAIFTFSKSPPDVPLGPSQQFSVRKPRHQFPPTK
jgi:hypothetical protein